MRVAVAPFHVVEGVQPEVDEGVGFKLLPIKLLSSWDRITSFRSFGARDKQQASKKRKNDRILFHGNSVVEV